jgi:hypothetical protein
VWWRSKGYCEGCLKPGLPGEFHHLHYRSLGRETPNDLAYLCRDCHEACHRHGLSFSGDPVDHPRYSHHLAVIQCNWQKYAICQISDACRGSNQNVGDLCGAWADPGQRHARARIGEGFMNKPRIDDLRELQDKLVALYEAGWRDDGDRRVDPPVARAILETHELGPELQQTLVAMAIGALATTIFEEGGPVLVETTAGRA